ncbi:GerAB/ArcD/ProY family transporter [Paenibacillus methanolicus]|uniref:Spore germination protein KB n=1 Tax=Paenibacillus methanolicus TaxID=582686 RepID=A0A5S5CBV8_9BACL|nr:endospore germination permease [Paenibacillus methanolicus]TYP75483.1 spore germination protein KB [Paenibacillus methanolicus]
MGMLERGQINQIQLFALVMLFTLGDTLLVVPGYTAMIAGRDGWLSGMLSVSMGMGVLLLYAALQRRNPARTLVQICQSRLGRWAGSIAASIYVFGFLLLLSASMVRVLTDFMSTQIMPNTPVQVIALLFLVLVVRAARGGIETIARTAEISAPWVMLLLGLLVMFVIPESHIDRIQPFLYNGVKPVIAGSLTFLAYGFIETGSFLMIFPFVRGGERGLRKPLLLGGAAGGTLLVAIIFFCLTVFGPGITASSTYPSYMLAKKIEIGEFLQRIEAIMAIAWLFTIFFKLTLSFYGICLGAAQMFKLSDYKLFTFPLALLLLVMSDLLAPNIIAINNSAQHYPWFDMTIVVGGTLLLLAVGWLKDKRGAVGGPQSIHAEGERASDAAKEVPSGEDADR